MSQERVDQILMILGENPCQSFYDVQKKLQANKIQFSGPKGPNSELIIGYIISRIPQVTRIAPFHGFIGDLDADFYCLFTNMRPVYVQIKTSHTDCQKFKERVDRRRAVGIEPRIVSLDFESSFDDTIADFVNQINSLEGKEILKPVKF